MSRRVMILIALIGLVVMADCAGRELMGNRA